MDIYDNNKIAYGKGNGEFGAWVSTGTNIINNKVKFADFDGDGDIDFVQVDFQLQEAGDYSEEQWQQQQVQEQYLK